MAHTLLYMLQMAEVSTTSGWQESMKSDENRAAQIPPIPVEK